MRTSLLTLLLCLLASAPCWAQDWAKAMLDHTSHDFGVVAHGAKVEHRFTLENIYLEDMRIKEVRSSCKCTTPKYSTEPVKTYDTTDIVAVVDTRKFLGRKEATLRVILDEPFPGEIQLHVYTYIRSDVVFEPGEVQFGSVAQGIGARRNVKVLYAPGRRDWEIVDVLSSWPHLQARVSQVSRTPQQVVYDLWVVLKPDAPAGYIKDHLVLVTNDLNTTARRVPIAVEGVVTSAVSAGPSPLQFGVVEPGKSVTRQVVVRGQTPFRVVEAAGPDERFACALPDVAAPVQLIAVTFTAGDVPGKVAGAIRIQTDVEGTDPLEVTVDGIVAAAGEFSVEDAPSENVTEPQAAEGPDWQPLGS